MPDDKRDAIDAAQAKWFRERKRREFVDGEVVIVGGRFVDPERVTLDPKPEGSETR